MLVESERTFHFAADPPAVWDALGKVEDYRSWWPWLVDFDATGLVAGDRWECTIRPPLPYTLHVCLDLDQVEPHRLIAATVSGDISGRARVTIDDHAHGCDIRLQSALEPRRGLLRKVSRFAPWLARFGHDWVLDSGHRQFSARAL